jgi:glyoxylase-like metal-dependent hydrolase (beta-lactamase superfamily II)
MPRVEAPPRRDQLSLLGRPARYPAGLQDLGNGIHAWLQPNGDLGESNAGLIVGEGESLVVDTLWDTRLTRRMLDAMAPHTAAAPISRLVNTHGDPDHCWGNQLLKGAEIIATRAGAKDMMREDPRRLRLLGQAGNLAGRFDARRLRLPGADKLAGLGAYAKLLQPYDFTGIELTPPTLTFDGTLDLDVGGRKVCLLEVGPAHTPGDLLVHIPDADVLFAADLMFVGVTPIIWVGPVENWIAGLDRIIELKPRAVVPGHGPLTDLDGVRAMREYWEFLAPAVRERVRLGLSPYDAAREIVRSLEFAETPFASWDARERTVVNAATIARNDRGEGGRVSDQARLRLIAQMGELGSELA